MGQRELLKFLKKKKKFVTVNDIADAMDCTTSALNKQLNQLVKFGKVKKKKKKVDKNSWRKKVNHFKYKK